MDSFNDDIIVIICSFLYANGVANLALTCKHFGAKSIVEPTERVSREAVDVSQDSRKKKRRKTGRRPAKGEKSKSGESKKWSLIEEAARRLVANDRRHEKWKDLLEKRKRGESWVSNYQRLLQLKSAPLAFDRFLGSGLEFVDNDVTRVRAKERNGGRSCATAMCQKVMTHGKHTAIFKAIVPERGPLEHGRNLKIGVMRPVLGWPKRKMTGSFDPTEIHYGGFGNSQYHPRSPRVTTPFFDYCKGQTGDAYDGSENTHCFFFDLVDRTSHDGVYGSTETELKYVNLCEDDRIGMHLDLDDGTLEIYKNELLIDTTWGFNGHYCWAVSINNWVLKSEDNIGEVYWDESSVRIESAPIPGA